MKDFISIHKLVETVISVLDARDPYTFEHSWRVAHISELIAKEMGIEDKWVDLIHIAAHLHDIGKVGIPDNILNKQKSLSLSEFELIKAHSRIGYNIVKKIKCLEETSIYILHHHERWDGSGYPLGLKGKDISLGARIIAIADCFDAMTTRRCYKNAISVDDAIAEIASLSGKHFCPESVAAFLNLKEIIPETLNEVNLEIRHHAFTNEEISLNNRAQS